MCESLLTLDIGGKISRSCSVDIPLPFLGTFLGVVLQCITLLIYIKAHYMKTYSSMLAVPTNECSYFQTHHVCHSHTLSRHPLVQLHRPLLVQIFMHIKGIPQQMRLMSPSLPQALELSLLVVVQQDRLIVRMCTLVNNDSGSLFRTQTTNISQTLLRDDDIQVVLGLIYVCTVWILAKEWFTLSHVCHIPHRNDTGDPGGIGFGRSRRWRVHYTVLRGSQEVRRAP